MLASGVGHGLKFTFSSLVSCIVAVAVIFLTGLYWLSSCLVKVEGSGVNLLSRSLTISAVVLTFQWQAHQWHVITKYAYTGI